MIEEKLQDQQSFQATMMTKEIRGRRYGSCPVVVRLGGNNLSFPEPTFAVACDDEKHINLKTHVLTWLVDRGLSQDEAEMLLEVGSLSEELRSLRPKVPEDARGLYFEEVGRIVDSVIDEIKACNLNDQETTRAYLWDNVVAESCYLHRPELIVQVLLFESHRDEDMSRLAKLASSHMGMRAQLELFRRPEYRQLPKRSKP